MTKFRVEVMSRYAKLLLIATVYFYSACRQGGRCEQARDISKSEIAITFKNINGQYIYTQIRPLYNKDSLRVLDPTGNSLVILSALNQISNSRDPYYVLSFGSLYDQRTDGASFDSELCKDFIVQYNSNERDTIRVCFKSKSTECGSVFETLRIYNKGQLLCKVSNDTYADLILVKD